MSSTKAAQARAQLKYARQGGSRARQWKQEGDASIYDEVSEPVYKSIVRDRLQQDDFVENDGIDGYEDNGMDDFEDAMEDSEDEKEKKKRQKAAARANKAKAKPLPEPAPLSAYRPIKTENETEDADFLQNLLGGMTAATTQSNPRKRKGSQRPDFSTIRDHDGASSDGPDDFIEPATFVKRREAFSSDDEALAAPSKRFKTEDGTGINILHTAAKVDKLKVEDQSDAFEDEYGPIDLDIDIETVVKKEESPISLSKHHASKEVSQYVPLPAPKKEEKPELPSWLSVHASLPTVSHDTLGGDQINLVSTRVQALEDDGTLRMFWLDYLELDGKVYLVGKVLDKAINAYVSACVTVENIERNLFVLPRDRVFHDGHETDIQPTQLDVQRDFEDARREYKIGRCGIKWVKRNYAFGEADVPTGLTWWMKVVYPFSEPAMPSNIKSPNFARIFGTNTSAFELFVLKRKIMGPCWLEVKNVEISNKGISWCKLEGSVANPKDIRPLMDDTVKDMPPLSIMSISVRTVVNHVEKKREIVCIAARIWENNHIEDASPIEQQPCVAVTYIRPLGNKFPQGFEALASSSKHSRMLAVLRERDLLNNFLALVKKHDPDVIVGHDFLGVTFDILLHRMREQKVDHWSRISRFKRKGMPNIGRQGTNLKFLSGRLLCDLSSDGAKGMIASTTWSLTEMVASQLKVQREEIDAEDTSLYFDCETSTGQRLQKFVQHCELDAFFQMSIASKVQILPLTRQLTNLAGNSWNKTLNGGRAERNEYILLHEFHSLKYICPDKTWGKKAEAAAKIEAEDGDGAAAAASKSKRDKYKGGLVFEPKRGLWDKIILVMDFNSLYPSIIQEYNIDFTTVERPAAGQEGEDDIPPVPYKMDRGVLPRLIAQLVERRKTVKGLMKSQNATAAQRMQWDIKQQALKLTANSMYGCLGFEYSRFYAKPLAALTTFKGREILTQTRELAESMGLDVIYGDTDSVFVNSNHVDLAEALKVAHHFKKSVNERYRLLEIDVDGVFQRLLLLQKKKYAAIKVENNQPTMEVKGLDMKRREYCALSKNASKKILEYILSGDEAEIVVVHIHDYLTALGQEIRNGSIDLEDFIIFKRLGKNPEDYPDAKTQPHVQVALRLKEKNKSAKAGDVVPYVFCLGEDGGSSKTAQADKAYHPDEIKKNNLKIDFEYYLSQQILPPIERLCDPIEGTDRARLAECLGLDHTRYQSHTVGGGDEHAFGLLSSQITDKTRFQNCSPFIVTCRKCKSGRVWHPPSDEENELMVPTGVVCATSTCRAPITGTSLQTQLEVQIRACITRYYEGWMVCDDSVCGRRTRMMRVYGKRCLSDGCRGVMGFEYDDSQLYDQLLFYASLFDSQKILDAVKGSPKFEHVNALVSQNAATIDQLSRVVERFLNECGRRWVDLDGLFGFMTLQSVRR